MPDHLTTRKKAALCYISVEQMFGAQVGIEANRMAHKSSIPPRVSTPAKPPPARASRRSRRNHREKSSSPGVGGSRGAAITRGQRRLRSTQRPAWSFENRYSRIASTLYGACGRAAPCGVPSRRRRVGLENAAIVGSVRCGAERDGRGFRPICARPASRPRRSWKHCAAARQQRADFVNKL